MVGKGLSGLVWRVDWIWDFLFTFIMIVLLYE